MKNIKDYKLKYLDFKYGFKKPIKKNAFTFLFFGNKGSGKTIVITFLAFLKYLENMKIYSNYQLNFDYIPILSISELKQIKSGVFLGDDFETWASSKYHSSKEKKDLIEIMINFRKKNIYMFLTCKRPLELDKSIRGAGIDYYVECNLKLKFIPYDIDEFNYMKSFLDSHVIELKIYDGSTLKLDNISYLDNLDIICQLYDTTEVVKQLYK